MEKEVVDLNKKKNLGRGLSSLLPQPETSNNQTDKSNSIIE